MKKFPKKFLAIFCTTFLISSHSYALDVFVGADALFSNSRHEIKRSNPAFGPTDGEVEEGEGKGYSGNIGIRQDLLFFMVSAEAFYDNLNITTNTFRSATGTGDKLKLKDRYGAKLNAGMSIFPNVQPFITAGLATVNYDVINPSLGTKDDSSEDMVPLYGVGLLVDLPFLDLSVKAAYDYQRFNFNTPRTNAGVRNHLGVARLGLVYRF